MIETASMDDLILFGVEGGRILPPSTPPQPRQTSELCQTFEEFWHSLDLMTEFRFSKGFKFPTRKSDKPIQRQWRMDYIVLGTTIGIEIHGGVFGKKMRHTTGTGFTNDREKMNAAIMLGWKTFELSGPLMTQQYIDAIIEYSKGEVDINLAHDQIRDHPRSSLIRYTSRKASLVSDSAESGT